MGGRWRVPEYTEIRELGVGAQARVVLARSDRSGETVAIKYLAASLRVDEGHLRIFRNEARILTRVANPHIARLHDYVEGPGGAAIVMEAVTGSSLRVLLDKHKVLRPEAALTVLKGSVLGLAAAHAVGVVHRDYKPDNVVIQADGKSKLIDFGIAVLTGQGDRSGTPAYMAPEQWSGDPATPATDVYSATCVFYECVTGARPFRGGLTELMAQHTTATVPLTAVPEPLRPLVASGMAKDPSQRRWDAEVFIAELERVAVDAYGTDWERRGWSILAAAAGLSAALPLALLDRPATAPNPGPGPGPGPGPDDPDGHDGASGGGPTAEPSSATSDSVLSHTGFGKAGFAIAAIVTVVVIGAGSATTYVALGTSEKAPAPTTAPVPGPGGVAKGTLQATFTRPDRLLSKPNMPAAPSKGPQVAADVTVTPARVHPGTQVRLTIDQRSTLPYGVLYQSGGGSRCVGPNSKQSDVYFQYRFGIGRKPSLAGKNAMTWLHPAAGGQPHGTLPGAGGIPVRSPVTQNPPERRYDWSQCAHVFNVRMTVDFTVPTGGSVLPGKYTVSPWSPVAITEISVRDNPVSPAFVGARVSGALPVINILPTSRPSPSREQTRRTPS